MELAISVLGFAIAIGAFIIADAIKEHSRRK